MMIGGISCDKQVTVCAFLVHSLQSGQRLFTSLVARSHRKRRAPHHTTSLSVFCETNGSEKKQLCVTVVSLLFSTISTTATSTECSVRNEKRPRSEHRL